MIVPQANDNTDVIEERTDFISGQRTLEAMLAYSSEADPSFSALIAGPHPLMGGDLDNNVVRAIARGLAANGGLALAFNYSGAGESNGGSADWHQAASQFWQSGAVDQESTWPDDTVAAREALVRVGVTPTVEIGYSFGCWAITEKAIEASNAARILISPNPNRHGFERLSLCRSPLLVIHSDNDFACPPDDVRAWFKSLRCPKSLRMLEAGEHFFRKQEHKVLATIMDFLAEAGVL